MVVCKVEGCNTAKIRSWGMCGLHYDRWYRNGDPHMTKRCPSGLSIDEKLRYHGWTVVESGCWEWNGRLNGDGYGVVKHFSRYEGSHRWAYRAWVDEIPPGKVVRHDCDNRRCINPQHLQLGTQADNVADTVARGRQRSPRSMDFETACRALQMHLDGMIQSRVERIFGLGSGTISRIKNGHLYPEVSKALRK